MESILLAWSCCCRMVMKDKDLNTHPARLERFLQLCAEDNVVVANATTPANFFHLDAPTDASNCTQASGCYVSKVVASSSEMYFHIG